MNEAEGGQGVVGGDDIDGGRNEKGGDGYRIVGMEGWVPGWKSRGWV